MAALAIDLMRWSDTYWLLDRYEVQPGTAVVGGLMYPGVKKPRLPLRIVVEIADERFEFVTAAK